MYFVFFIFYFFYLPLIQFLQIVLLFNMLSFNLLQILLMLFLQNLNLFIFCFIFVFKLFQFHFNFLNFHSIFSIFYGLVIWSLEFFIDQGFEIAWWFRLDISYVGTAKSLFRLLIAELLTYVDWRRNWSWHCQSTGWLVICKTCLKLLQS